MENTQLVMRKGHALVRIAKVLRILFFVGLGGLLITVLCAGEYCLGYLALSGAYLAVNLLMLAWYVLITLGICFMPCYFTGLILIGIGQVCVNTMPKQETAFRQPEAPRPAPTPAPVPAPAQHRTGAASAALINSLRVALSEPWDGDMIRRLREAEQRLTKPNEKQILSRILNTPAGKIRQLTRQIYEKLTENA